MNKRLVVLLLLTIFLTSLLVSINLPADETPWCNKDWSYREEIIIPIDTKNDSAKYQPIDINIKFNSSCWAVSEEEQSIRVIFQNDGKFLELESQIYDLNYTDKEHINSCNLVFFIPREANGNGKYYIYYDDERKPSPNYQKRVNVEESYYQYEPIQGLKFEISFYKITEGEYIVYGVAEDGKVLGNYASQQVMKLKEGSKDIMPCNLENAASFNLVYWFYKNGNWYPINSAEKLISSQVFVNGNLMVKLGIVSQSNDGLIQSTVIYKYYYCPTENKRLYTHVRQEIIKYPLPTGSEIDVSYIQLHCGGVKSSTIQELNFGDIPPYLHFYSDDGRVLTQNFDQYPDCTNWEQLIKKQDDYDLGSSAWISVDYGETGRAHAIIFDSNKILKSGDNERDGIELQLYESKNIRYPGLNGCVAELYLMRNAYEKNEQPDEILPENYVIEFNAEYFTTESGGYPAVEKEASAYQKLISYHPQNENNVVSGDKKENKYSLTVYVHPFKSLLWKLRLSKLLLKNTYISVELLNDDETVGCGRVNRIPLKENLKIDWQNISLFQKMIFSNILPGKYVVKICLENSLFSDEKEFIGYAIVDLQKDTKVHVFCKPEGKISVSALDQNKNGIQNTQLYLIKDGTVIAEGNTDQSGKATIKAPCGLKETYTLNATYKGFLVNNENVRLGITRRFSPLEKTIEFDIHDLKIIFNDSDEKAPSFDLNVGLTSDEMYDPIVISADNIDNGTYTFGGLYTANYTLEINYNLFDIKEKIRIPDVDSLVINLYDFTAYVKDSWDLKSEASLDISLTSNDLEKTVVICGDKLSNDKYVFSELYPGNYTLKVSYKMCTVEQSVNIRSNGEIEIDFPAVFNVTTTVLDARGNPLKDAEVLMTREGKEIRGITDKDGNVAFSIPPGVYVSKIYYKGELIAERKVNILNEKYYSVVTTNQPLTPFIVIGLSITLLIGAAIFSYRKKDIMFFLGILAIILIIIAIFSPWWTVQGSSTNPHFETSTKLYLVPAKMVTITSNVTVTAGELVPLDEKFVSVITLLTVAIGFCVFSILAGIIISILKRYKISLLVFLLAIIILIGSIVVFFYAISELANATVGSVTGNANLDVNIPGENMYETMTCSWGPSIGFYLLFISAIVLVVNFLLGLRKMLSTRIKKY